MKNFRLAVAVPLLILAFGLGGCTDDKDAPSAAPSPASADSIGQLRKYTQCMRDQGVDMPDPNADGRIAVPAMKPGSVGTEKMEAASEKCRTLLPDGGEPQKIPAEELVRLREFSKCLRANGLPDYPDPDPATGAVAIHTTDITSDAIDKAAEKCQGVEPSVVRLSPGN